MDIWKAGPDVMKKVKTLIAKFHPELVLIEEDIIVLFREKSIEKAGKVTLGVTKKAPPLLPVLTEKDYKYKFIIELGADSWQTLSDKQQMALLDHHLCSMLVQEDEEKGTISCSIRPLDFYGYKEEVERWGMWWPMSDDILTIFEDLFGKDDSEKPKKKSAAAATDELDDVLDALNKN